MKQEIRCVHVWPGWLRLSHWLIGFGVLFELFSAWAITHDNVDVAFWHDWHLIVGQVVLLAVLLRLGLLAWPGVTGWRALLPGRSHFHGAMQTLKFYVTLARSPLPNWHSHNPFWAPVYLVMLLLVLGAVASGLAYQSSWRPAGLSPVAVHAFCGLLLGWLAALHILAVFLHDWKGRGAHVSGMINGYRYFHIEPGERPAGGIEVQLTPAARKDRPDD